MQRYSERLVLLLLDFDEQIDRLEVAREEIPEPLRDRVFILGVWSEPETLKAAMRKSCEAIGQELARDCREDQETTWMHDLLKHNAEELVRLRARVRPILFPSG
jgi:beta-lactamase class D